MLNKIVFYYFHLRPMIGRAFEQVLELSLGHLFWLGVPVDQLQQLAGTSGVHRLHMAVQRGRVCHVFPARSRPPAALLHGHVRLQQAGALQAVCDTFFARFMFKNILFTGDVHHGGRSADHGSHGHVCLQLPVVWRFSTCRLGRVQGL